MRAEAARVSKIPEQRGDRQHADKCDDANNTDWNVALGNRQRVGLACFARARRRHRAGEPARNWLHQF